jgi:hypothetical protein
MDDIFDDMNQSLSGLTNKDGYQYVLGKPRQIGKSMFMANEYMKEWAELYKKEEQRKLRENKIKRILGE